MKSLMDYVFNIEKKDEMTKLYSCPFCGSSQIRKEEVFLINTWKVTCTNCGSSTAEYDNEQDAILRWNVRMG